MYKELHTIEGYNSWSFVQNIGERLVCAYSRGLEHSISERCRGVYAQYSDDGGVSWSEEVQVVNTPDYCESAVGKGVDCNGAMLLWVRCIGDDWKQDLYKSSDGLSFDKIASPKLDPMPMQITDVFRLPDNRLMSLWFAGRYRNLPENSWGTLVSYDNGVTWEQRTVEANLEKADWPTEPSCVYLGDGRIFCVSRSERCDGVQQRFQFQMTSNDYGMTWEKKVTNIGDVSESTPSLIWEENGNLVFNYYYHRGKGELKCRVARLDDVWNNPLTWPEPVVVARGSDNAHHAGNVNAVSFKGRHFCTFYSGNESNTCICLLFQ